MVSLFQPNQLHHHRHSSGGSDVTTTGDDRLSNNNVKTSPAVTPVQGQTPPASPLQASSSRRLLQDALSRLPGGPFPMIVMPERGGYWIDGTDHECHCDHRGQPFVPQGTWRAKIETDDTAKCYRRFFVGRVSNGFHL